VSYQAAICCSDWARVAPALSEPFKSQGRAYRRICGAGTPPKLVTKSEPRFCEAKGRLQSATGPKFIPVRDTVRGTFLHFGGGTRAVGEFDGNLHAPEPRYVTVDDLSALHQGAFVC
jgi:hypothetical protein